jgi:hypothetical protein
MTSRSRALGPDGETNPLILALAEVVRSAVRRRVQLVTWAVEHDVELVEPCACRHRNLETGCVCNVELALGARWMRSAAVRVADGRAPGGPPPKRFCRLCRSGEHDLDPTTPIKINASDGTESGTSWVAVRVRRSPKADRARAVRAGGLPPGTHVEQLAAAGLA